MVHFIEFMYTVGRPTFALMLVKNLNGLRPPSQVITFVEEVANVLFTHFFL